MHAIEQDLSKRIKNRIKELTLVQKASSHNKGLLHRIDELQSLLGILHIFTTANSTLVEKITDLEHSSWLGQVVSESGETIYHTYDCKGICISPGLSTKERSDLSIENYGA